MKLNTKTSFVHSLQHQSSRTALVMLSTCTLGSPAGDELRTRLEGGIAGLICPEEIEKPTEAGCSECSNMSCKIIRSWNVMWKIIGMSWNHEQMRRKKMENPWVSHFFAHAIHLCRSPEAAWTQEPAEAGHLLGWLQESLGRCFFLVWTIPFSCFYS